jgi:hypothetical protein
MLVNGYRWALEIHREDGSTLDRIPVSIDWEPAREQAFFTSLRKELLAADAASGSSSILPRWHADKGPPWVDGFAVHLDGVSLGEFDAKYFRAAARKLGTELVDDGRLRDGEVFRFRALAVPAPDTGQPERSRDVSPPLDLREAPLSAFTARSSVQGAIDAGDFPVFVPEHLLEEVRDRSRGAGDHEIGGFLVGHLHRDTSVPEVFLEITGHLPAKHVVSTTDRLTFTERTWTDAQAMLDLRGRGEQWAGWWHRHPVFAWCANCVPEKQRTCSLARDFFSAHDRHVHRTVFARAYNVALVFNDTALVEPSFSLFGWRQGTVGPRGFHLLEGPPSAAGGF